jgi:hypothetical protein
VADILSGLSLLHLTKLNKRKKAEFTAGKKKLARNRKSTKRKVTDYNTLCYSEQYFIMHKNIIFSNKTISAAKKNNSKSFMIVVFWDMMLCSLSNRYRYIY